MQITSGIVYEGITYYVECIETCFSSWLWVGCTWGWPFYFLYKEWFQLGIFSTLTPEQTYKAFIYSLAFSLVTLVVLVIAHIAQGNKSRAKVSADHNSIAVDSSGKNSNVTISKG
ncbi:hypothetical protein [Pseudoalteromonas sp. SM9913]|uniref:hypothetical protein n=1 Tax=Pseudoalteromonas sp. (strain SM9913) TaxID=234831 RepID=UPI00059FED50|nr:hypothetical protein [Pseudoalteromonas sp. SM9913]